jgi:metal-responsive CopG/Arc/MetJ family transcriptional regulator
MKTAISVPDELFEKAELEARRLKMSRSELYSTALAKFLTRMSDDEITRKLNEVYGEEPSTMDPVIQDMAMRSLRPDQW